MKKNNKVSCIIPDSANRDTFLGFCVLGVLAGIGFWRFSIFFSEYNESGFAIAFERHAIELLFSTVFILSSLVALAGAFLPNKKKRATLVDIKKFSDYYLLTFEPNFAYNPGIEPEKLSETCKVLHPDFLVVGNEYTLVYLKMQTPVIKEIHEDPYEASLEVPFIEREGGNIFWGIFAVFPVGGILLMVYAISQYPEFAVIYLVVGVFFTGMLYTIVKIVLNEKNITSHQFNKDKSFTDESFTTLQVNQDNSETDETSTFSQIKQIDSIKETTFIPSQKTEVKNKIVKTKWTYYQEFSDDTSYGHVYINFGGIVFAILMFLGCFILWAYQEYRPNRGTLLNKSLYRTISIYDEGNSIDPIDVIEASGENNDPYWPEYTLEEGQTAKEYGSYKLTFKLKGRGKEEVVYGYTRNVEFYLMADHKHIYEVTIAGRDFLDNLEIVGELLYEQ